MNQRPIILILFLLFTTTCFGQEVDSLIISANKLTGKSQIEAFEKIGLHFYNQNFTTKAKEYFKKSYQISKKENDSLGQMNALKGLLRTAYHKEDSVALSMEYAGRLEELSVDYDNKLMQAYVLHHYGRADKENLNKSIEWLKRALKIYEDLGENESASIVYRELGNALLDTAPSEAFMYFQKHFQLAKELDNQEDIHLARSNISSALIAMKQYEDAREFCTRNIEIAEKANDPDFLAYNYLLIGISFQKEKNYSKAIEFAMKGKEICEANNLMDKKQYTYQLLKEIYNERGNYTEAFEFFAKEKQIEAVLEKEKATIEINRINAEHELEKRMQEIEAFKKITYYRNLAKNAGLVLLGIAAFILYLFNVRKKLKVQLQKEELEKLKVEQMLELEEKERLKERLEYKERELASSMMFTIQKNKMLSELKEKIATLKVNNDGELRKQVNRLGRNIELNMNFDDDWQKFKMHFDEVHPDFFKKILQVNNALNLNDTRFCAYIRMGLSTKEIAQIMGISASSVQKARYRLKKKLQLEKDTNLISFIAKL